MILASVTTPLLGIVDTAVVGHLDEPHHLGGVAVGATIFTVLFMGLNFLRMGTTGVTAQAWGAGHGDEVRQWLAQALIIAVVLAGLMVVLQPLLLSAALALLGPGSEVARSATDYFTVRIWSAPASLANFVLIGWLLGMQNARGPLAMTLTINAVNIVLDLVFVMGFGMAARGVALATLLAEVAGVAVGGIFVRQELARFPGRLPRAALRDLRQYRRLAAINLNLLLRTLALMFVFAFITAQGARTGDAVLAANALLMNLQYLLSYALDGIANAAEALVGKAVGAASRAGLEVAVRRSLWWSVAFAFGFTLSYAALGPVLVDSMTSIPAVAQAAREFLPWLVLSPLVSVWAFLYDGVFVGATRPREMRQIMLGSAALVFLPTWFLARGLGNHGLWLAFMLFMAARGIGMHWWYRRLHSRGVLLPGAPLAAR
jgi:MATE family multidrug resistance protein